MKILGIETSCDETAAAIVEDGWKVHSNVIASSMKLHERTGGVVPEVAARDSVLKINEVIRRAREEAGISWEDIDAIAVTNGPGLLGSLLVGIEAAKTLTLLHEKPIIPVFHIAGHILSNLLEREHLPEFPVVSLTVAGGHNDLYLWAKDFQFRKLGGTIDDAAGEAFDKGARMLGLSYPGGPALSRLAETGNPNAVPFPRPMENSGNYDFSFSGLKTALYYTLRDGGELKNISPQQLSDLAASYENAITDVLIEKLFAAAEESGAKEVHLAGGVSANRVLREKFLAQAGERKLQTRFPEKMSYSTDNAAMIAGAGYFMWQKATEEQKKKFVLRNVEVDLAHAFRL